MCYKLSQLFALTQPSSADRVRLSQPIDSLATLIDVWTAAPRLLVVLPSPSRETKGDVSRLASVDVFASYFLPLVLRDKWHLGLQSCSAPPLSKPLVPFFPLHEGISQRSLSPLLRQFQGALHILLCLAAHHGFALVIKLPSSSQAKLHLGDSLFKVQL